MVQASEVEKKQHVFCPDCGEGLIRKAGQIKIPHFAHGRHSECHALSEGETPEHLGAKWFFHEWEITLTKRGSWKRHCQIYRNVQICSMNVLRWKFNAPH
ncbi:MAG: hypothetical protein ACTJG1_05870 [Enterococcus gilvus]